MARVDNRGNLRGSATSGAGAFEVSTRGARDFLAVSKYLKTAGETGLRKEFHKAVRDAAKPLIPKVRDAARTSLPSKGGLNERIARKPYRVQARTGAKTAGVRIVGTKVDPRINDQGRVAHPTFGRPRSTVVQTVESARGYFDRTLEQAAPSVQGDVVATMNDWTRRLLRGEV